MKRIIVFNRFIASYYYINNINNINNSDFF